MDFIRGLIDPLRGFTFLTRNPRLWVWVVIPAALLAVVYVAALWGAWVGLSEAFAWILPEEGKTWAVLAVILTVLAWLLGLWVAAMFFIPIAMIIAAPFNDILSEKTEKLVMGNTVDLGFSLPLLLKGLWISTRATLIRAAILFGLLAFAFCFNLIPGFGQMIYVTLSIIFTAWILSLEFTAFSMDRRHWSWSHQRQFLRDHRGRSFGFGLTASLLMVIPVINLAFIPASAVAGTLLFCETVGPENLKTSD